MREFLAAVGLTCSATQADAFERLVGELLRWNRQRNLTAISHPELVWEKHLADSLTLLPYAQGARRLLDLGSGAGFPALPLKIACPHLEVVAVDAVAKKIAFQRHMVRLLALDRYTAWHGRAESLSEQSAWAAGFDLITARALGELPLLASLARPCLGPGGTLIAMKGRGGGEEVERHRVKLETEGWTLRLRTLRLPESGAVRCLVEMQRRVA